MEKISYISGYIGIAFFFLYGFYIAGFELFKYSLVVGMFFIIVEIIIKIALLIKQRKEKKLEN